MIMDYKDMDSKFEEPVQKSLSPEQMDRVMLAVDEVHRSLSPGMSPHEFESVLRNSLKRCSSSDEKVLVSAMLEEKVQSFNWGGDAEESIKRFHQSTEITQDILTKLERQDQQCLLSLMKAFRGVMESIDDVGAGSEAYHHNERRLQARLRVLDGIVSSNDSVLNDRQDIMLDFIKERALGLELSTGDITKLIRDLDACPPLSELEKKFYKSLRKTTRYLVGFLEKDIKNENKLNKGQKNQIQALDDLIERAKRGEHISKSDVHRISQFIRAEENKQRMRESKQVSSIMKRWVYGEAEAKEAFSGILSAAYHPFEKVLHDDDLKDIEKFSKLGTTALKKGAKGVRHVIGFAAKSAQSLTRSALTQPPNLIAKTGLTAFNLTEALGYYLKSQTVSNDEERIALEKKAQEKLSNAEFNAMRALCALVSTVIAGGAVVATVCSAGAVSPAIWIHHEIYREILETIHYMRDVTDGLEGMVLIGEHIERSSERQPVIPLGQIGRKKPFRIGFEKSIDSDSLDISDSDVSQKNSMIEQDEKTEKILGTRDVVESILNEIVHKVDMTHREAEEIQHLLNELVDEIDAMHTVSRSNDIKEASVSASTDPRVEEDMIAETLLYRQKMMDALEEASKDDSLDNNRKKSLGG